MKTSHRLLALAASVVLGFSSTTYADSKRTAEYLLTSPSEHQDKEVTVDVAMVKPVQWVSPAPEFAFFRAMTIDRSDRKAGGDILIAVPAGDTASFARKYGTDFEGRNDFDSLKGSFLSVARAGGHENSQIWIIDTTGKLAKAIEEKKLSLPADGKLAEGGRGSRLNQ